jgi:hypothetical protein
MTTKDVKEEMDQEQFLERWSRLKQDAQDRPPQKAPENGVDPKGPPPELPPLDKLTLDSDYRAFFHPKVGEDVRRAALKKLFSDPRFNVMDGLDVYVDDYSKTEPIPPAMLAGLRQAQKILEWAKGEDLEKKEGAQEHAEPDAAASSQPKSLDQRTSPVTASVASGEQAGESISGAPDQAPSHPSPEKP